LWAIRGAGKLTNGKTHYARARYAYRTLATGSTLQYTDYCDVRSFVYREGIQGDVNSDNEVNIADINAVIDAILSGDRRASCDVNGDGEVTIADITTIIEVILNC
jgi:hypothetical protein